MDDEEGYIDIYGASATNRLASHQRKKEEETFGLSHILYSFINLATALAFSAVNYLELLLIICMLANIATSYWVQFSKR